MPNTSSTFDPPGRISHAGLLNLGGFLRWTIFTFVSGVALTALAAYDRKILNQEAAQLDANRATERAADTVQNRIRLYQYGLRGARGAILAGGGRAVTRDIFHRYSLSRDLAQEFPGSRSFGFARRVAKADEAAFLARTRADGAPDFQIRMLTPHDGERYVVEYIEPLEGNAQAVGLDNASETARRQTAETALLTGEATLSAPITLVQAAGETSQALLFFLPVYDIVPTPTTAADRQNAGFGWTFTGLLTREVMRGLNIDQRLYHLKLTDVTEAKAPQLIYRTDDAFIPAPDAPTHMAERTIYGRRWQIELTATPAFSAARTELKPSIVISVGLIATLLATALAAMFSVSQSRKRAILIEQARRATIIENSSDAIIGQRLDGTITSWNRAAERLFGYPAQLAVGQKLVTFLTPEGRAQEDANLLSRIAVGENVQTFDTVRLHRDGTPIDVAITAGPMREADGRITGAAKHIRDIRHRVREARQLKEFNAQLEREVELRTAEFKRANTLLNDVLRAASEVSIISTDTFGTIRLFNRGAERMLGYRAEEMLGRQTPAIIHLPQEIEARSKELSREYGQVIVGFRVFVHKAEREGSELRRWTYVRRDGSSIQVNLVVTTMRDDTGAITGYLGIAVDVTAQVEAVAALEAAKVDAEAANIAKSRFLATMSHEIRTPINGILGMAQILLDTDIDTETRNKYTRVILESGQTLSTLLTDILDFSKIEAGKIELEHVPFSPERILEEVRTLFATAAQQKGLACRAVWRGAANASDGDLQTRGAQYIGDPFRIRQMLSNLVSNAIKFTNTGEITIEAALTANGGRNALLEFSVTDTGIGIPATARAVLFQPFAQAESSTTRKFGGTGLGLSIVRSLSVLMGGETGVTSDVGKGSRFWFRIPVQVDMRSIATAARADLTADNIPADVAPQDRPPLKGAVLVAEDVATNRFVIEAMLSKFGLTPVFAEDGSQAVAQIKAGAKFDIILMDVQMPVMDGYDATRAIRAWEKEQQDAGLSIRRTPILALTAAAYDEDRVEAAKAGMDGFLTKPLNIGKLYAALAERLAPA